MGPTRSVRGLGLRARVTSAFALGALLLSVAMAVLTYTVTRSFLIRQRESTALRESYLSAQVVRAGLRAANSDVPRLLGSVETESGSKSLIRYRNEWFSSSLAVGRDAIPGDLRTRVEQGQPARQLSRFDGDPQLAIGIPLPAVDALYFELVPLTELDRTLRILASALAAGAGITTVAGAAVGRWAATRLFRPLHAVSDIRLDAGEDRDLAVLADSFNAMVDALQARIERDARFASDVSHELRSPLTTLSTSVDVMLSRRDEIPERPRQALDLLAADVRRFERLVQDLLEISRADAGAAVLAREEVRLAELVLRAIGPQEVEVEIGPGAGDATVMADKRRIEQVVTNLATNAILHGGGLDRVGILRDGDRLLVQFDDRGPGVAEDFRERIFERFARGSSNDRRADGDGVGLGLSLVKEHMRLHGGAVWVEDRPGGGARFVIAMDVAQ
jgi:two-component system, OmpR family, sensor histidine kinase MtrB